MASDLNHRVALTVPENVRDRQPPKTAAPHSITVVDIFHHRPWELLQAIEDPSPSEGTRHEHHHRPY